MHSRWVWTFPAPCHFRSFRNFCFTLILYTHIYQYSYIPHYDTDTIKSKKKKLSVTHKIISWFPNSCYRFPFIHFFRRFLTTLPRLDYTHSTKFHKFIFSLYFFNLYFFIFFIFVHPLALCFFKATHSSSSQYLIPSNCSCTKKQNLPILEFNLFIYSINNFLKYLIMNTNVRKTYSTARKEKKNSWILFFYFELLKDNIINFFKEIFIHLFWNN